MAHPPGDSDPKDLAPPLPSEVGAPRAEPPVVARLVVEIRSDGSTTIARGAVEDLSAEVKVCMEAKGTTPAALAASLVRSLLTLPGWSGLNGLAPRFARRATRALLPGRRGKPR
ncbi:MAG TPA: hypothetical protein DFS52_20780 [Myxococcales bacterium]|nr:hypothetical protein [Myxococcales bacterium]